MSTNTQIIIRKEKGLSVIWVSQSFLMKYCDGLSDSYLRTKARYSYSKGCLLYTSDAADDTR